ncbi:MAG TPA: molybdenum cofactor guanylyltransferase [Nitrospirota bacterium]|nr:molybdenum cofactor guanylyltransferase [Nitrospirota bacterium]
MTGIVLSGGENRRMGTDKAFLKVDGMPMIEHVLLALRSVVSRVIIVTNSPGSYASYGVEVVTDACNKRGSLVGIYSGLLRTQDDHNIVVACDMPFLNPRLLSYMTGLAGEYDIILPKIGEFVEPLHAVYHRRLLPAMEDHIKREQLRIRGIFTGRRLRYVTEEEIDRIDPTRRSFVNLNTTKEYKEATCLDLECRS